MQNHLVLAFLGGLLVTTAGCKVNLELELTDETRSVDSFTGVNNRSDADVTLAKPGNGLEAGDVLVSCAGDFVADVSTVVDANGTLIIDFAAEVASIFDCTITVVTEDVTEVITDGDGDIVCEDPLVGVQTIQVNGNGSVVFASVEVGELNILVGGTGAVTIDEVTVDQLNIELRGTGDATLGGTAGRVDLLISGSGSLAAKPLVAGYLNAALNGTGNAEITVNGIVDAAVDGDSTLDVYGAAEAGTISELDGGTVVFH
ncbi:MAG: DUF2807 domain-containing protein [Pseudomonadota bacterium]|nr:DUF2807 domain-containing protein [Pseudomonadota bacterium]